MVEPLEFIDIQNQETLDILNGEILGVTENLFVTPYIALERVRKVLGYFNINLPAYNFMEAESGNAVFPIHQFGEQSGIDEKGEKIVTPEPTLFLYFEYDLNEDGTYTIYSEAVNDDDLSKLLNDFDEDMETLNEMSPNLARRIIDASKEDVSKRLTNLGPGPHDPEKIRKIENRLNGRNLATERLKKNYIKRKKIP